MRCVFCGEEFFVPGESGGTYDTLSSEEVMLMESLTAFGRGLYRRTKCIMRAVGLPEFTPVDAHSLALTSFDRYPGGLVVIHLGMKCAFNFTMRDCQSIHIGCAIDQLLLRLSVGVVISCTGKIYALQLGRRRAPFVTLVR